ncbi:MAG: MFS transporter [Actinobacteria bacterium]|nr:MFS transporter [Actinomycetota bacterium]MCO5300695.1 MFS transporter [Candidatus Nanopelagicales bacterium]MCB9427290.1 MFS transporter [Actinomycetota bacterium]HPE11139.1 MFS transporter [Actinomycetota bacterium]HPQ84383.1 MFS transporter [Actinomycetota bacterium]
MSSGRRAVLAAVAVNLMGVLALFLTGAMSVQLGREFEVAPATIGALASVFALSTSIGSAPLGRQVRRLGVRRSLWTATAASSVALLICAASRSVLMLGVALLIGGLGNAIGQPAGNALVAANVRPARYGLGFGIKQSGIPLATTLGGLAVPLIALTVGWRFAYLLAAAAALVVAFLIPGDQPPTAARSEQRIPAALVPKLWLLSAGLVATVLAATSIGALGAAGGVEVGLTEANAGYLVALGGAFGLIIRLGAGVSADRRTFDPLRAVAGLCVLGAVGWFLMASGTPWLFVIGLVVANAFGWGWPGLQHLAVARRFPSSTAAASGVAQTGVAAGLLIGPVALGTLANTSWSLMWLVAGCAALLGAAVILVAAARMPEGGQRMSRGSGPSPVTPPTL